MGDPQSIVKQVAHNCAITDARHATIFSVCGLALRLRGLYKWEKGLDPWVEEEPGRLMTWIEETEIAWEKLENLDFIGIRSDDRVFDPFNAAGINGTLEPSGMIYGAGYAQGLAPTFFMACLKEARNLHGCSIFILGKELARDLMSIPALSQDNRIYIRTEVVKSFLWDQIFFINRSGKSALNLALQSFKAQEDDKLSIRRCLPEIVENETESFLFHELGEVLDPTLDRMAWRELLAQFPNTVIELLARTLKDIVADTSPFGRLSFIVKQHRSSSLAFFVAFLDGFRKILFPEIFTAFERFVSDGSWEIIEEAVRKGYQTARERAGMLMEIFQSGKNKSQPTWTESEIHRNLIQPLGLR